MDLSIVRKYFFHASIKYGLRKNFEEKVVRMLGLKWVEQGQCWSFHGDLGSGDERVP